MKTKQQILKEVSDKSEYVTYDDVIEYVEQEIHNAMNEFAKQEAIEFAVFCANNVLGVFPTDVKEREWYYQDKTGRYNKTTEQLYELFLQSKSK